MFEPFVFIQSLLSAGKEFFGDRQPMATNGKRILGDLIGSATRRVGEAGLLKH